MPLVPCLAWSRVTLWFTVDGRLVACACCNSIQGPVELSGGPLRMLDMCTPPRCGAARPAGTRPVAGLAARCSAVLAALGPAPAAHRGPGRHRTGRAAGGVHNQVSRTVPWSPLRRRISQICHRSRRRRGSDRSGEHDVGIEAVQFSGGPSSGRDQRAPYADGTARRRGPRGVSPTIHTPAKIRLPPWPPTGGPAPPGPRRRGSARCPRIRPNSGSIGGTRPVGLELVAGRSMPEGCR